MCIQSGLSLFKPIRNYLVLFKFVWIHMTLLFLLLLYLNIFYCVLFYSLFLFLLILFVLFYFILFIQDNKVKKIGNLPNEDCISWNHLNFGLDMVHEMSLEFYVDTKNKIIRVVSLNKIFIMSWKFPNDIIIKTMMSREAQLN